LLDEICFKPARTLARLIRARKLSATEVVRAFIGQIERVNPKVNAIVTFLPDEALKAAKTLDRKKDFSQPFSGLPIAIKDVIATKGVRTTWGSLVYKDHVPAEDHIMAERIKAAGAILIGKTNTPECGMAPFADGGDFAASLRNPGNYCNVIGFRPSTGRVPAYPHPYPWSNQSELGPMARTVSDAAFLLSVQAGPDRRAPTSIAEPGSIFNKPLGRSFRKTRIAWSKDLGGLPVEPAVTKVLEKQRSVFKALGCVIEDAEPDFSGAVEAFETLRSLTYLHRGGKLLKEHREKLKDTVIWNTEQGLAKSAADIARAEELRTALYHRVRVFLEKYEFLVCPVNQLPPFSVDQDYPREIAGVKMENYLDWMKSCYFITITGHPAISVPAGFTDDGLPVGIQIVGRYRDDFGVLQIAHAFEEATQVWKRRPAIAS
jgi:amidase